MFPDQPNIWADGSMEPNVEVAGAGVFTHFSSYIFKDNRWGHAQDPDGKFDDSSHMFAGVTGPLQVVGASVPFKRSLGFISGQSISTCLDGCSVNWCRGHWDPQRMI